MELDRAHCVIVSFARYSYDFIPTPYKCVVYVQTYPIEPILVESCQTSINPMHAAV